MFMKSTTSEAIELLIL